MSPLLPWILAAALAVDGDFDGFEPPADCDDTDPSVFPGSLAMEIWYDGIDQNCDGLSDYDRDLDGFDDASALGARPRPPCTGGEVDPVVGCGGGTDCNDSPLTGADIHPLAGEICEAVLPVDNDCDGSPNTRSGCRVVGPPAPGGSVEPYLQCGDPVYPPATEAAPANTTGPWFPDLDGDGAGDAGSEGVWLCDVAFEERQARSWVSDATDCDDTDPARHPLAVELCNGLDDNCNEAVDEPTVGLTDVLDAGCTWFTLDADEDGHGRDAYATSPVFGDRLCLCEPEELEPCGTGRRFEGDCFVQSTGDCDDADPTVAPGRVAESLHGVDHDCDGWVSVLELDCDGDGALPLVPTPGKGPIGAEALGLDRCAEGASDTLDCRGPLAIRCHPATGLWSASTADLQAEDWYQGPRLVRPDTVCTADCDDQCPLRCVGRAEICDGIDNDCAGLAASTDALPRSLTGIRGWVAIDESDLDGDGGVACEGVPEHPLMVLAPLDCQARTPGVPEPAPVVLSGELRSCGCRQGGIGSGWLMWIALLSFCTARGPSRRRPR